MHHHDVAPAEREGREVGRRQNERSPARREREHALLPRVPRPVRQPCRRGDDAVAIRPQLRQAGRQLARDALDASDLMTRGGTSVDEDVPALIGSRKFWQRER
jgi:hypothetical protein